VTEKPEEPQAMQRDRLVETAIESAGILLFLVDESGLIQLSTGRQDFLFPSKPGQNPIWNSIYYTFAGYPNIIQNIERTLKGESQRSEVTLSNRLLEARYIPLLTRDNRIEGVVLTFTDITRHRQTEAALKEQESYVHLLQEIAVASNEAGDVSEVLQYAVDRVCSVTGWPVGHALPAKDFEDIFSSKSIWHLTDLQRDQEFRRLRDGLKWVPEIGLPGQALSQKAPKWFIATVNENQAIDSDYNGLKTAFAFPILAGKEAVGVLEFFSDHSKDPDPDLVEVMVHIGTQLGRVVERKRSEYLLRESEETFRSLFEDAGIGVILQSLDGIVLEANPAFQSLLGYDSQQIRGMNYCDFTHPEDLQQYQVFYSELTSGKRPRIHQEKRYLNKDRGVVWATITASLLHDTHGSPKHVILLADDITESRQLQNELAEVRSHLLQFREQERLNIARDLHDGPLQEWYGIIYSIQEMIEISQENEIVRRLVDLRTAAEQQISDLRSLSNELRPPSLVPFGLAKAIDSHADQFQEKHPEFKLHVELEEDGKLLPEEMRINLFRIYQELLNNIVRHAQASQVFVRFYIKEKEVELQVQDDGAGFEVPERWVETARQGHFGLLGARERAESFGGKLLIQSDPGKGTLVRVLIGLPHHVAGKNVEETGYASRRILRS
jgi:PAS domain S-box-containing protein